jgi:hypothetical protein
VAELLEKQEPLLAVMRLRQIQVVAQVVLADKHQLLDHQAMAAQEL